MLWAANYIQESEATVAQYTYCFRPLTVIMATDV
jgi:hypothetical protein